MKEEQTKQLGKIARLIDLAKYNKAVEMINETLQIDPTDLSNQLADRYFNYFQSNLLALEVYCLLLSKRYKVVKECKNEIEQHSFSHPLLMASRALYLALVEKKYDEALELVESSIDQTNQKIIDSHSPIHFDKPLKKSDKVREYEMFGLDVIIPYNIKLLILRHIPSRKNELYHELHRYSLIHNNFIANRIYADLRFHELPHYKNWYRNQEHIAIRLYSSIIERFPKDPYAYNQRGVLKYKYPIVREISSIDDFSKAIDLNPQNPIFLFNRAKNYASEGEYGKAIRDFQALLTLYPKDAFVWHQMAKLYFHQIKDYQQAINAISKAIEIYPDYPFYFSFRAKVFEMLNQYEDAIDDYLQAINLTNEDFLPYLSEGKYTWINELLTDNPSLNERYKFASLESEYKNSSLYQYCLHHEDNACVYDRDGYQNSLNQDLIQSEINILFKNNEYPKEKYRLILELTESEINELINQIELDKKKQQYYSAMEKVNMLSLIDPHNIDLYFMKYELATLMEDSSQKYLEKILNLDPGNFRVCQTFIHEIENNGYDTGNGNRKLIDLYTKLIEIDPENWENYYQRGNLFIKIEEYNLAETDIQKAYKISPMNIDVLFLQGNMHYFNKKFIKSINTMTKIIEINEDYIDAYKRRGRAYHKLKMYKEAADDFCHFLQTNPSDTVTLNYLQTTGKYIETDDEFNTILEERRKESVENLHKYLSYTINKFEIFLDMMVFPEEREGYFD